MGYYSTFKYEFDHVILKKEGKRFVEMLMEGCTKDDFDADLESEQMVKWYEFVEKRLKELSNETIDEVQGNGFCGVELVINNNGELEEINLDDYYAKFYDDSLFAIALSIVMEKGEIELYFTGDDGEKWHFIVTPDNVVSNSLLDIPADDYFLFKRWLPYINVLEKIRQTPEEKINVGELGVGTGSCKIQQENAKELKQTIRYLFSDLSIMLLGKSNNKEFDIIFDKQS